MANGTPPPGQGQGESPQPTTTGQPRPHYPPPKLPPPPPPAGQGQWGYAQQPGYGPGGQPQQQAQGPGGYPRQQGYGPAGYPAQQPSAYWPLTVIAFLCSFVFGGIGMYYSGQVGNRWRAGDVAGAQRASKTALIWGMIGIAVGLLIFFALLGNSGETTY